MRTRVFYILLLLMTAGNALAKDAYDRLQQLENKINQMEANKVEQNAALAKAIAELERIQAVLQSLGGGTESQTVQLEELRKIAERQYRDLEMRLTSMEQRIQLLQTEVDRAIAKVAPQIDKERKAFQEALDFTQRREYAEAVSSFEKFIKSYPKSPSVGDARFWVAECRYEKGDYSQAIKDYQKFVELYPKSSRAPMAILKQGDGFLNLQMKNEAKVFWKKLVQEYPKSTEAFQAKEKLTALEKSSSSAERKQEITSSDEF